MRDDVLRSYPDVDPAEVHVVHNGIDTERWAPRRRPRRRPRARRRPGPARRWSSSAGSPGRRACRYFLRAAAQLPPDVQLVLCAGAPDTPEILAEVEGLVARAAGRPATGVVWIDEMLPRAEVVALLSAGDGLRLPVDLRAARHRQPRGDGLRAAPSSATATGGIPEVVVDGETGWLVPIEQVQRRHRHARWTRTRSSPTSPPR